MCVKKATVPVWCACAASLALLLGSCENAAGPLKVDAAGEAAAADVSASGASEAAYAAAAAYAADPEFKADGDVFPYSGGRNLFFIDKGYATAGVSKADFDLVWDMANLTARIYHDLWDSTLDAVSPYLIPKLDFNGNSSKFRTVRTFDSCSGFYAELVRNTLTGEYVLVYRGTNPLSLIDWVNNAEQALYAYTYIPSAQYDEAVLLARSLKAEYPGLARIAGHSLGGGLAQLAAIATGLPATCFNSAGLSAATVARWNADSVSVEANKRSITHVNVKYDPLSDLLGRRNSYAPFAATPQYGGRTLWLRNVTGTGFVINPLRISNHMYHVYVYQLKNTYRFTGNFL